MEPTKVYPFPCTQCRARYFCHCASLEAAGWCWKCKVLDCPCPKKCDVFDPICMECIALENAASTGYAECIALESASRRSAECKKCGSPYECVCDLLIENGNCPTCMKLVCTCITSTSDKIDTPQ